jgi:alkanesulfonate monooxygenase SsuD/methylene tetrahydromethanopterin reductase-like flavin-dependent oxidoreductase (luciferase family)
MMNIKDFSIFPMLWGPKPAQPSELIELATHAERLGFYSFTIPHVPILPYAEERPPDGWIWKHIPAEFKDYQFDALVLLPMLAQATRSIRIGFNVVVTPWLHPFVWAKYMASLDVAAQGRVIAGFGLGHAAKGGPTKALDNIGISGAKRGRMSDEALEFITRLWTEEGLVSFEGEYFHGHDLVVSPKPLQKPYPEVWWAGVAKPSIRRAAQYGSLLEVTLPSVSKVRDEYVPQLAEANELYGGNARLGMMIHGWVRDSGFSSKEDLSQYFFGWEGERLEPIAAGNAEQCADVIRRYRDAGMQHFVIDFHRHGLDHVGVFHDQMERWTNDVLPLLG